MPRPYRRRREAPVLQNPLDTEWMKDAACAGLSGEELKSGLFSDLSAERYRAIERYCDRCPVRSECTSYAMQYDHWMNLAIAGLAYPSRPRMRKTICVTTSDEE